MRKVPTSALQKNHRSRTGGHGDRGLPPLPSVSLASLPDDCLLNEAEVAAYVRAAVYTVSDWRRRPGHPLAYVKIYGGRVRYLAGDVKAFLGASERRIPKPDAPTKSEATKPEKPEPTPETGTVEKPKTVIGQQRERAEFTVEPSYPRPAGIAKAVALFGSQVKLARAASVSKNTLFEALHGYRGVSHKLALAIERATDGQVRAEELILEGAQRTPKPEAAASKTSERSERLLAAPKTITPNTPKPYAQKAPRHRARHETPRGWRP